MSATNAPRILPAEVFDLLNHSAEAFGGIGAGSSGVGGLSKSAPNCALGHARFLYGAVADPYDMDGLVGQAATAMRNVGIHEDVNDAAVGRINRRRRRGDDCARVPFEAWAKELHVVRGPA